jgi:lambda family phage portal protein
VPANEIIHLRIAERWPQTRGVPWLHTVIGKLRDIDGYSEAEIIAARGAANYMAWVKTPTDPRSPLAGAVPPGSTGQGAQKVVEIAPGLVAQLGPGEELNFISPNRPNPAMDPFLRMMLREVAAGCGTSYESLSRDYSQSNYSSSRLALLDDRDLWRVLQQWFIRSFRAKLHPIFLQQAILSGAVPAVPIEAYGADMRRYCAARYKPRGWTWIDPTKEVEAFAKAVRNGFTTVGDVISKTGDGADLEDVLDGRSQELKQMQKLGLEFDTDPDRAADGKSAEQPKPDAAGGEDDAAATVEQGGSEPKKPQSGGAARIVHLK